MATAKAKRKEETAYHEAGHTIAYILTERKFRYVTIKPDDKENSLGHLMPYRREWLYYYDMTFQRMLGEIIRNYAGVIAEYIYMGKRNHIGASADYQHVCDRILTYFGQDGPPAQQFLKFIRSYTEDLLRTNWPFVEQIANGLLEKETLTSDEVYKLRDPEMYALMERIKTKVK